MSRHDRGISPNPHEGNPLGGDTAYLSRRDLTGPLAQRVMREEGGDSRFPRSIFSMIASNPHVQGLALYSFEQDGNEHGGVFARVIHDAPPGVEAAKVSFLSMNLLMATVSSELESLNGRTFEEVEQDLRGKEEVVDGGKLCLEGIIRFTE